MSARIAARWSAPSFGSIMGLAFMAGALSLPACHTCEHACPVDPIGSPVTALQSAQLGRPAAPAVPDPQESLRRSRAARRAAQQAENAGSQECVDLYYESAAFAYTALGAPNDSSRLHPATADLALAVYNESVADCLSTAGAYHRFDPHSQLLVNTPAGPIVVPVVHRGFVWQPSDFNALIDARSVKLGSKQKKRHLRQGLGAPMVAAHPNPELTPADRFLYEHLFFSATAVLRPDVSPWLAPPGFPNSPPVLELIDPLRVRNVEYGGRLVPLAADLDAPVSLAEQAIDIRSFTFAGFFNPSTVLDDAKVQYIEPYQPGKTTVLFIHGLADNPFIFADAVNDLRSRPGFLDQFQFAFYRYPTGVAFLQTGAILRQQLQECVATLDPQGIDSGLQNMVIIGFSMGGLESKLQIMHSGDALWRLAFNRPIESLVTTEETRELLRRMFYFEPLPFIKRAIFVATPHDGSSWASNAVGRISSRLVQPPPDAAARLAQLERDNPGAVEPFFVKFPSAIDLLEAGHPLLRTMQRLPINPATIYHTLAGTDGHAPDSRLAKGDLVVALPSAHIPGAASELRMSETHFSIYRSDDAIREIESILYRHNAELGLAPVRGDSSDHKLCVSRDSRACPSEAACSTSISY